MIAIKILATCSHLPNTLGLRSALPSAFILKKGRRRKWHVAKRCSSHSGTNVRPAS